MVTVFKALLLGMSLLKDNGIDTPRLDAEVILAYILGCSRLKVMTSGEMVLSDNEYDDFLRNIDSRAHGKPVAYIIEQKEFMGLEFIVSPGVLIPRSDTEIVVETVINECARYKTSVRVVDIGCGSGAIGISIAYYCTNADVTMIDISDIAVELTYKNAERNGLSSRVRVLKSDLLSQVADERFNIIVSNPPYIETDFIPCLERGVREYEPQVALDGGADGLNFYREITSQAKECISDAGMLIYETGCSQAEAVEGIMTAGGFKNITVYKDLAGLNRCISGRKISY